LSWWWFPRILRRGEVWSGMIRFGMVRLGQAGHGEDSFELVAVSVNRFGGARRGRARRDRAWRGVVWQGLFELVALREYQVTARLGGARLGEVGSGKARTFLSWWRLRECNGVAA